MEDRQEWNRNLFKALTSRQVSRNKFFARFSKGWFQSAHKRFKMVESVLSEAQRLSSVPETLCWISENEAVGGGVLFHLNSPRLCYKRVVALEMHEWEWLVEKEVIQTLIKSASRETISHG